MNNQNSKYIPGPNPVTQRQHTRQVWIQILLPLLVGVVAVIVLAVFAALAADPQVTRWGNISAVFLIIPLLLILLVKAIILFLLVFLLTRLLRVLPGYAHLAQMFVAHYSRRIMRLSDKPAQPVIRVNAFMAGLRALRDGLRR